jgi:hypothetical protein
MLYCQFCGANLREDRAPRPESQHHPSGGLEQRLVARGAIDPGPPRSSATERPPIPRTGQFVPMASAGAAPTGRLVTIGKDGAEGTSYPLTNEQIDLGRKEGVWHARDLASLNGFYIRVRQPRRLLDADLLLIGLQVLRFEAVKDAEQGFGPATQHGTLLFGSPMLPRYARLAEHTVEGVSRNVFYLHRDETIIGRESGDIVFTEDPFMSRRHLAIRFDGGTGTFTAVDLGSSNGTYVAVRGETPLADGDFLRVGQHLFRIDIGAPRVSALGGSPGGGVRRPS